MSVPESYRHWQEAARRLLEPISALLHPGRADIPIAGLPSDHDAQADRLESFARPLLVAAHWLQTEPTKEDTPFRHRIAEWFRQALVIGADPKHPQYFGPDASYHQHHVEMGLLSIALQIAPQQLWDPLTQAERDTVAHWLGTSRGGGIVNNNHLFMSIHILEFLNKVGYGHRTDRAVITAHLNQLETMHRGGGWFEDGINQAYDHYNAYAFHFYGLWWARLHGRHDESRARRWREWARSFLNDYHHFFAASGEHPAFGRSIMYRFNTLAVFGLAAAEKCTDLPLGQVRRLCTRNLDFFLERPIYQEQGLMSFGWVDTFPPIAEVYSCAASPYWAAKGLSPLLLPPSHPFWNEPEQPLASERGNFAHVIKPAGLLIRGVQGEVEIINAGSMVSNTQTRYGPWKWSKIAYRTGVSFTLAFPPAATYSFDSALTIELDDKRIFGRHSTVAVEMDEHHVGYSYGLGFKIGQVNTGVETYIWWKRGWLLQVHLTAARQPVVLRLGGYPLSSTNPRSFEKSSADAGSPVLLSAWGADGKGTVLQPLGGFTGSDWDQRLDDVQPRAHIVAPYHVTPVLRTERHEGERVFGALSWCGVEKDEAAPWSVVSLTQGRWQLRHPKLGDWDIRHEALPVLG